MLMIVRDARSNDTPGLARLITSLGYPATADQIQGRLAQMRPGTYRTLVAEDGGILTGFIGLLTLPVYEHDAPIGWILALCVAEDRRGRGIGRALLNAADEHYRAQGVVDVRLHSGFQRDGAHEFYEKMGFDKSGYRFKKRLS
jgi:GNAT superfamily N-acetyltransferase